MHHSALQNLPSKIKLHIFAQLPAQSLPQCALTCQEFHQVIKTAGEDVFLMNTYKNKCQLKSKKMRVIKELHDVETVCFLCLLIAFPILLTDSVNAYGNEPQRQTLCHLYEAIGLDCSSTATQSLHSFVTTFLVMTGGICTFILKNSPAIDQLEDEIKLIDEDVFRLQRNML